MEKSVTHLVLDEGLADQARPLNNRTEMEGVKDGVKLAAAVWRYWTEPEHNTKWNQAL